MKFRTWISLITVVLLALLVIFAWDDVVAAFGYLGRVNLWVLALMIPVQFISYYATGAMIFSYLRAKGNVKDLSVLKMTRMSLELNFVNHVFPSGGASGMAYLGWLLSHHGVRSGRATMAQIIRYVLTFMSFVLLLMIALVILIIDHSVDRLTILLSLLLVAMAIGGTLFGIFLVSSRKRLLAFGGWFARMANRLVYRMTKGKKRKILKPEKVTDFFDDIHDDYLAIRRDKRILVRPFVWAVLANLMDAVLIMVAFWSFGVAVNPAIILIGFGVSALASVVSVAPGGAGVYEAVMVAFLSSAGVPLNVAIAGTLLARVLLVLGTIAFGAIFYQLTVIKYGKAPTDR